MAKSGNKSRARTDGEATRERIIEAAADTLCAEGFAGTSARSIAAKGGFNQALVFYHFGSVNDLLMAALAHVGHVRMATYTETVGNLDNLSDLVSAARSIFAEDLDRGYMKVLSEMISGASTYPELGPRIWQEIEPWISFTKGSISRVIGDTALTSAVPAGEVAFAIVSLYLGMELLTQLAGQRSSADSLFGAVERLGSLFAPFIQSTQSDGKGEQET